MTQKEFLGELRVGEPTVTKAVIARPLGINAAWFDEYPNFNLPVGRIDIAPTFPQHGPDLMYRPNDRLSLGAGEKVSPQVGGTHYGNPATDVYAFAMANNLDPMQFNIVKYVTRFRKKDGMKDLKKAMQTLERLMAHEEGRK